jgi:hypothetical protein
VIGAKLTPFEGAGYAAPSKYLPAYDAGDHLHPNADGFKAMAAVFNLNQL